MIKNFTIFKVDDKKSDKAPDYRISSKVGESYVEIGAAWIKESNGKKFLSCKLGDRYVDHTDSKKTRNGFHIAFDPKIEEGEASLKEINDPLPDLSQSF